MNELFIAIESPYTQEALDLLERLRAELSEMYPDELTDVSFHPDEISGTGAVFLLARIDGAAVGCGAIRPHGPGIAEVKRMFVTEVTRGRGVGRRLLQALELEAKKLGYDAIKLETGLKQRRAISLYESEGFRRVPCYGQYANNSMSICFEKHLCGNH